MKKKLLLSILLITFGLTGCTYTTTIDVNSNEENVEVLTYEKPTLTQTLDVVDEDFKLLCTYDTGTYPLEGWHVTDDKSITMKVKTENLSEGYEVYIDHMHADISLCSISPQINGITQDTMDDTCHALSQDGFYISNEDEYYNIFAIEGYTEQFYRLWDYAYEACGTMFADYKRMTEENIVFSGTYGEKLTIVYDLSIKKPGSDRLYTKSVLSELIIPVAEPDIKRVKVNMITGKIVNDGSNDIDE